MIFPKALLFFRTLPLSFFLLTVFLLSNFAAYPASAPNQKQSKKSRPYALIFGTVWGPNDLPVYGVRVRIRRATDKANKARWELLSDHQGEFAQRLPAGKADYLVWADLDHFKAADGSTFHSGPEVPVHVENDERVDIGLHLTR